MTDRANKGIDWDSVRDLGKTTDAAVAERLGCSVANVFRARQKRGIAAFRFSSKPPSLTETRALSRAIADAMPHHRHGATISAVHLAILLFVASFDWCSVRTIVVGLGLAQATTSDMCTDLVARDLLNSERDTFDHRLVRLTLTPKAKRLLLSAKRPPMVPATEETT